MINYSLITSQFDTAPKHGVSILKHENRLITSQFDTAPKPQRGAVAWLSRLITSQFDTAPKPQGSRDAVHDGLITSQFDTAPKRARLHNMRRYVWLPVSSTLLQNLLAVFPKRDTFDYQSVRHCSKTWKYTD